MRKVIIILVLLFFTVQTYSQVYFGFKVGANFSNFSGDIENTSIKTSFHIGGVAEVAISDLFSVQPEILYSAQGFKDKEDSSLKYNYNYINLPIMVKYFVNKEFSIDAGPQVGFLIAANYSTGVEELTDVKESTNAFDYGFNIGGSYEMENGMNINIRYNYGFANVINDDLDTNANNNVIQISLGYKFY